MWSLFASTSVLTLSLTNKLNTRTHEYTKLTLKHAVFCSLSPFLFLALPIFKSSAGNFVCVHLLCSLASISKHTHPHPHPHYDSTFDFFRRYLHTQAPCQPSKPTRTSISTRANGLPLLRARRKCSALR